MTINSSNLTNKTDAELAEMAEALTILSERRKYNKLEFMYPEKGLYRKEVYPTHVEFFNAGKDHTVRAMFGGNGVGKTTAGGVEFAYHLTGLYPRDWNGKRFNRPIKAWGAARENKALKEVMQEALFGKDISDKGTGFIPKYCLLDDAGEMQTWAMAGTSGCILTSRVRHYTNGTFDGFSTVDFKTYAQGWQEFQGANRDLIWIDEEPDDPKVYSECLARTRGPKGKEGILYVTFTPLLGYTTLYLSFLPGGQFPTGGQHPTNKEKYVVLCTWKNCPHLSEEWKTSMIEEWKLTDPNSIDARINGIASIGTGRIYPIDESFVVVQPFEIPEYWPRAYGMDFGYHATAVIWAAQDPSTKTIYLYAEYKRGKVVNEMHATAIKQKGDWIPGIADPSGGGRRDDGSMTIEHYGTLGLRLIKGVNAFNSGVGVCLSKLESGALKIFDTCTQIISELRTYRYDTNNPNSAARNQEDHLLDAMRYLLSRFDSVALSESDHDDFENGDRNQYTSPKRDNLTGY